VGLVNPNVSCTLATPKNQRTSEHDDGYLLVGTNTPKELSIPPPRNLEELLCLTKRLDLKGDHTARMMVRSMLRDTQFTTYVNQVITHSANGSGNAAASYGVSLFNSTPSALFQESDTLSLLFDEFRNIRVTIKIVGLVDAAATSPGALASSFIVGFNPNSFDADGSLTIQGTARLPYRKTFSGGSYLSTKTVDHVYPKERPWASVASFDSSLPDAALGAWWIINSSPATADFAYLSLMFRNKIKLRNRI
jgi:hypothetical protein